MPSDLAFTGERFLPGAPGSIAYEHWHRYAFALRYVTGRRVLDAACGEGYGSALLAQRAKDVTGIDIDTAVIAHASRRYEGTSALRYSVGSVVSLPLPDASVDVVVSFETIEHLPQADQPRMLAEFARVLAPDGVLLLSSPNRRLYSEARNYHNPFHLCELDRAELDHLLAPWFPHRRCYHQVPLIASSIWGESSGGVAESWTANGQSVEPTAAPEGIYYLVLAGRTSAALAQEGPRLSVFQDSENSELHRAEEQAREVLRLDGLLRERDQALGRQHEHVLHLEALVAERERLVEERDRQLADGNRQREALERAFGDMRAALAGEQHAAREARAAAEAAAEAATAARSDAAEARAAAAEARSAAAEARAAAAEEARLHEETRRERDHERAAFAQRDAEREAALAAQERLIAYHQSFTAWVRWPARRLRLWWRRFGGGPS